MRLPLALAPLWLALAACNGSLAGGDPRAAQGSGPPGRGPKQGTAAAPPPDKASVAKASVVDRTPAKGRMPKGLSGFMFGATQAEITTACTNAGHHIISTDGQGRPLHMDLKNLPSLACTGEAVETGYKPVFVVMTFCESGTMCEAVLHLSHEVEDYKPKLQQGTFDATMEKLSKKYGPSTEQENSQPVTPLWTKCAEDKKDVNMRHFWSWPGDGQIILFYSCKGATGTPSGAVGVLYQNSEMRRARINEYIEKEQNY